jgi:cell division ATPase FtsA
MAKKNPLIIGLDVGTYKIGVIVAEVADGGAEIVSIGTAAWGPPQGVVSNMGKRSRRSGRRWRPS